MTVVKELDKSLFDGYIKPKTAIVMQIARSGILDPNMDWYETPQPSGNVFCRIASSHYLYLLTDYYL